MINQYKCCECDSTFSSILAVNGHKRIHKISSTESPILCSCVFTRKIIEASKLRKYQETLLGKSCPLEECRFCRKLISKTKKFCNNSCAAKFNNTGRIDSEETRKKKSCSIKKIHELNRIVVGEYCKLIKSKCAHCSVISMVRLKKKYCEKCNKIYAEEPRNRFKFTFNVYKYPELFDIQRLILVGWYSPKGKSGKWNPEGLSRDHRVSVNEALKYGYDPYYITHPMNCELMPHNQNNKKKTKSSLLYDDLVSLVDKFDRERALPTEL